MAEPNEVLRTLGEHEARLKALELRAVEDLSWLAKRLDVLEELVRRAQEDRANRDGIHDGKKAILAGLALLFGAATGGVDLLVRFWRLFKG